MKMKSYLLSKENIKSIGDDGRVTSVFSTMNVVDKDNDVTIPGAFGKQRVKISPAHDWSEPGLGFADIHEVGNEAIAEMQFYLDMPKAAEWFTSIKRNHEHDVPQEYSYGFNIEDASYGTFGEDDRNVRFINKVKVFEVSPVMLGAGRNTRTLSAKAWGQMRGSWESVQDAIRKALNDDLLPNPVNAQGQQTGWVGIEGTFDDSVVCSLYKSADGGETQYFQYAWSIQPDGKVAVFNREAVDLQVVVREKGLSISIEDHLERGLDGVFGIKNRLAALAAMRAKEGRVLSRANRDRLSRLLASISNAASDIDALLAETDDDDGKQQQATAAQQEKEQLVRVFGEFQLTQARLAGHIR